jgi:hypothetical protein
MGVMPEMMKAMPEIMKPAERKKLAELLGIPENKLK